MSAEMLQATSTRLSVFAMPNSYCPVLLTTEIASIHSKVLFNKSK